MHDWRMVREFTQQIYLINAVIQKAPAEHIHQHLESRKDEAKTAVKERLIREFGGEGERSQKYSLFSSRRKTPDFSLTKCAPQHRSGLTNSPSPKIVRLDLSAHKKNHSPPRGKNKQDSPTHVTTSTATDQPLHIEINLSQMESLNSPASKTQTKLLKEIEHDISSLIRKINKEHHSPKKIALKNRKKHK